MIVNVEGVEGVVIFNISKMTRENFIEEFSEFFINHIFPDNILFTISNYIAGLTTCLMMQKQHFPEWWEFTSNYHLQLCEDIVKKIKEKRIKI